MQGGKRERKTSMLPDLYKEPIHSPPMPWGVPPFWPSISSLRLHVSKPWLRNETLSNMRGPKKRSSSAPFTFWRVQRMRGSKSGAGRSEKLNPPPHMRTREEREEVFFKILFFFSKKPPRGGFFWECGIEYISSNWVFFWNANMVEK